MIILIKAFKM